MPYLLEPDDDIRYYESRWLGPAPYTLMWHARYVAYGVFVSLAAVLGFVYWITPLELGDPLAELAVLVFATYALLLAVDHDKPLSAVVLNAVTMLRNRSSAQPKTLVVAPRLHSNMKWSHHELGPRN